MSKVLVLYHSQEHGNTGAMAEAVADGARSAGAEVLLLNTNRKRMEIEKYREVDAAAFGTPDYYDYMAGGMKMFLDDWFIAKKSSGTGLSDKPFGLFYSHGGGGKVRKPFEDLFSRMGQKVGQTVESCGSPSESVLEACRELGKQLAAAKK